jgi:hypothetical protein
MHTAVLSDTSKPKTRRASGMRASLRRRAGMAQRVSGRW